MNSDLYYVMCIFLFSIILVLFVYLFYDNNLSKKAQSSDVLKNNDLWKAKLKTKPQKIKHITEDELNQNSLSSLKSAGEEALVEALIYNSFKHGKNDKFSKLIEQELSDNYSQPQYSGLRIVNDDFVE